MKPLNFLRSLALIAGLIGGVMCPAHAVILNEAQSSTKPIVTAAPPLIVNTVTGQISIAGAAGTVLSGGSVPTFTANPFLGIVGTVAGSLSMAGQTAGIAQIQAAPGGGNILFQLPPNNGTTGYILSTDGAGHTSWIVAPSGGGGGGATPGGSTTQVQYNLTGAFAGDSSFTYVTPGALTLGATSSSTGSLALASTTSGVVTVQPLAISGTYNFNLPISAGTAGLPLVSGGGGSAAQSYAILGLSGGGIGSSTPQGGLNNLFTSPISVASTITAKCQGFSDEQTIFTAIQLAQAAKTSTLLPNGCTIDNKIQIPTNGYTSLFYWGGGPTEYNTADGIAPAVHVYTPGINSINGETAIDMNAARQVTINGVNFRADDNGTEVPASLISNGSQNNNCCASNILDMFNTSVQKISTVIGCAVDGNYNCLNAGGISVGTTAGGSGYVNASYANVPLTGGSGSGGSANITVAGTAVTAVSILGAGSNYVVGDILSASNTNLGNSGSGFTFTLSTVYTNTFHTANVLPRIMKSQFSDFNMGIANNFSDSMIYGNEFSCCGMGIQSIFGGGGNQIGMNRFEFLNYGINLGGPNGDTSNGSSFINSNLFTHSDGFYDISFGRGNSLVIDGNEFDQQTGSGPSVIIGGVGNVTNVAITGDSWAGANNTVCIDLAAGFTTDYISMTGIVCGGSATAVKYDVVPAHFVEDSIGSTGQHAEMGRPFGIGTSTPAATASLDLSNNPTKPLWLPHGTTSQRTTTSEGMIRYNDSTHNFEGVQGSSPAWGSLGGTPDASFLVNFLGGLTLSNDSGTPNTIIDIAAGAAADDTNVAMMKWAAGTKTTGAFTVGTGNGCLDTGSVANTTWYHIFEIERTDLTASDVLCSTSPTSPTMPANYTFKRRIGSIMTDGSAHILPFKQVGATFYWGTAVLGFNDTGVTTTATLETMTGIPTGVKVIPLCRVSMSKDGHSVLLTSPDEADVAPSNANPMTVAPGEDIADTTIAAGVVNMTCPFLTTNSAAQIRARSSASGTTVSAVVRGWID